MGLNLFGNYVTEFLQKSPTEVVGLFDQQLAEMRNMSVSVLLSVICLFDGYLTETTKASDLTLKTAVHD